MFQSRTIHFSLVGVAWSSTTINTVLTILETASFSASHNSLLQIAAASSALDAVSICCIGVYTFQTMRQRIASTDSPAQARILVGLNISLSGIALIVSLALICSIRSKWAEIMQASSKAPVADWTSHVGAQIAIWILSCISQIVLYSSPFWRKQAPKVQEATSAEPRDSVMSELRSPQRSRNLFSMEPTQPSSPLAAALPSPTFSSRSSHSLKSFRESLRHVVRPATSRTTLISRASFNRDARSIYSQSESFENVSHSDGFDSWDTSSVSLSARDVVMQSAPTRGRTLDPIPGSRPTTPGRALEGPFLTELPEEDEDLPHPPKMMPDVSRPPSPAVSEAHIHPLFRSESPAPPPEATPGTNILASPLANQAIACPPRPFSRMRSNSHLSQAQSVRGRTSSPHVSSRTPSPISRELTPPIPDYVLNASPPSPRGSMSGARKVQLQYSPDR
jgi:hypothetical protein